MNKILSYFPYFMERKRVELDGDDRVRDTYKSIPQVPEDGRRGGPDATLQAELEAARLEGGPVHGEVVVLFQLGHHQSLSVGTGPPRSGINISHLSKIECRFH